MAADMTLEVWPSDFLLPSVDAKCLQFMVCARFCAAPVKVVQSVAPWNGPLGNYPLFKHGSSKVITDFKQFTAHLKKQVPDLPIDGHLDNGQLSEITAFESFLEQNLRPAYVYTLWIDEFNSSMLGRWFGQQLLFPYGIYFSGKMKNAAKRLMQSIFPSAQSASDESVEIAVTKRALRCVNLLSAKLGDKKYFLGGNRPTSLDALVFGYLAPLLRLPLPNDRLQAHIRNCPNLVYFVDAIVNVYLPFTEGEITKQRESLKVWEDRRLWAQTEILRRRKAAGSRAESPDGNEYPLRDKVLFGIAAVVLSALFAIHVGLIQVEVHKVEGEDGSSQVKRSTDKAPNAVTFA